MKVTSIFDEGIRGKITMKLTHSSRFQNPAFLAYHQAFLDPIIQKKLGQSKIQNISLETLIAPRNLDKNISLWMMQNFKIARNIGNIAKRTHSIFKLFV